MLNHKLSYGLSTQQECLTDGVEEGVDVVSTVRSDSACGVAVIEPFVTVSDRFAKVYEHVVGHGSFGGREGVDRRSDRGGCGDSVSGGCIRRRHGVGKANRVLDA